MEPLTTSFLTVLLANVGKKALDLGQVFIESPRPQESKLRLAFQKLYQKPLSWIFSMLFSPFILAFAIIKAFRDISKHLKFITVVKILTMLIGFCFASATALIAGSYLGTITGLFFIKNLLGWGAAIGFLFGTTFSIAFTIILQLIVFNLMCFVFLKITKDSVIQSVYEEYIENK